MEKRANILVVEDEGIVARDIKRMLEGLGYVVPAVVSTGEEAVQEAENLHPDLVLMDIVLEGEMTGIDAAEEIRNRFSIPVIYLTAYSSRDMVDSAKEAMPYGYLLKPVNEDNLSITVETVLYKHEMERKLEQSYERLQETLEGTINTLASTVEIRDPYTAGHQFRVTRLAHAIAMELDLPEEQIQGIHMASLIHDIGKISVPAEILSKPGKLTEHEFNLLKSHSQVGHDILKNVNFPWPIARIVLQHHERMDGSGYPQGLKGEEILLEARIIGVADVVEAMVSHRPYRPALGIEKAMEEISQNRGVLYDPQVVDACLKLFAEKGFTFDEV